MTVPRERTNAVLGTYRFLVRLMLPKSVGGYARIPLEVRREARRLLKHYPNAVDLLRPGESLEPLAVPEEAP